MAEDVGFIYVFSNPAMPGLLKIGYTTKDTYKRLKELSDSTASPLPFEEEYSVMVEHPERIEKSIHRKLSYCRVNKNREFFKVGLDEITDVVIPAILWGHKKTGDVAADLKTLFDLQDKHHIKMLKKFKHRFSDPEEVEQRAIYIEKAIDALSSGKKLKLKKRS